MIDERPMPDSFNRQQTSDAPICFLTISHASLASNILVVSDPVNFVLDGLTYQGYEFYIEPLNDTDQPPVAQLRIQNIDTILGRVLRDLVNPARISFSIYALSSFNLTVTPRTETTATYIYQASSLYLTNVKVDPMFIEGRLVSWDYSAEEFPGIRATKDRFPGLFR